MPQLLLIPLSTFVSEDLTCIATGVLIAQGKLGFIEGTMACLAGIFFGDMLLYAAGRWAGPWARHFVKPDRLVRASQWFERHGMPVVIVSRFVPGMGLPTYLAAGLLKANAARFALLFLLAAAVWTPLLVGLGAKAAVAGLLGLVGLRLLTKRDRLRWEFWPPWLAYIPVVLYIFWLCLRHRTLTAFLAANPGMPYGGFCGESKVQILRRLSVSGSVPDFELISASLPVERRIERALAFLARRPEPPPQPMDLPYILGDYPVVLKPDVGQRGSGVAIIESEAELRAYLAAARRDTIIQRFVGGPEFGVFYCRLPGDSFGWIFSITEKRMASRTALGSHCRGARFFDGGQLWTPELESEIERIARCHEGFYFGRFDIRARSVEEFRRGKGLAVIELNGVTSEATHIYDPKVSVWAAYLALFRQWRLAFEIGRMNGTPWRTRSAADAKKTVSARAKSPPLSPTAGSAIPNRVR